MAEFLKDLFSSKEEEPEEIPEEVESEDEEEFTEEEIETATMMLEAQGISIEDVLEEESEEVEKAIEDVEETIEEAIDVAESIEEPEVIEEVFEDDKVFLTEESEKVAESPEEEPIGVVEILSTTAPPVSPEEQEAVDPFSLIPKGYHPTAAEKKAIARGELDPTQLGVPLDDRN